MTISMESEIMQGEGEWEGERPLQYKANGVVYQVNDNENWAREDQIQ